MTTTSIIVGLGGGSAYKVNNSLRLRSSNSAYLSRTFGTPTSATTWTISWWAKLGAVIANGGNFFGSYTSSSSNFSVRYNSPGAYGGTGCNIEIYNNGSVMDLMTANALRDPSAWYHFVMAVDTTQATASNRLKFYINGVQANFATFTTYPNQNSTIIWNTNGTTCLIGAVNNPLTNYYDGYLAEVNFVDGTAPVASSFGTFDAYGVWQPINYSGSYGNNGFHLTFGNTTSTTTLGYDTSPNGNNWTTSGLSLTAGATYDSMTDSPTTFSSTVANYAVINPLTASNGGAVSNGNLTWTLTGNFGTKEATLTSPTLLQYAEFTIVSGVPGIGLKVAGTNQTVNPGNPPPSLWCYYDNYATWNIMSNGSIPYSTGSLVAAGQVWQIAYNPVAGTAWLGKNNVWYNSTGGTNGNPSTGANPTFSSLPSNLVMCVNGGNVNGVLNANFGQQAFIYTPPTGYSSLMNTYNLPTPTIPNGALYMAATLYTGNGSTLAINTGTNTTIGTTFQTDLAWIKSRSAATSHSLMDVLRGYTGPQTSYPRLSSDLTNAEVNNGGISAFTSTGFNLNADAGITNTNGATYVAWSWKANGSGVSNTSGSITSTVSANTTAGFSVVTYTGNGTANATVGHGLGVAPNMILVKARNSSTYAWNSYHSGLTPGYYIPLNATSAQGNSVSIFPAGTVTSTVWNTGGDAIYNNGSGTTYVAYCWAAVAGYSAFGSYTGNGSTDGPFVYTGFRPRFVLFKNITSANDWMMFDTSRNLYNATNLYLQPDNSSSEGSGIGDGIDVLANGFKIRSTNNTVNQSSNTMVYAAFAENPFNSSRAR